MDFEAIPEFEKDVKRLQKRFRSLPDDLEVIKKVLRVKPEGRAPFSYRINNLGIKTCVIKVKKIACRSLKGKGTRSGLRLVYALFKEKPRIVFIELYHKSDQANEDRNRINVHFN